jgi:flagellar biosynthetic protein FliQ
MAADLCREALTVMVIISLPAMLVGLVVGTLISLIQSITSLQEQTITFVPKLIATLAVLVLTLPWTFGYLSDYSRRLILSILERL